MADAKLTPDLMTFNNCFAIVESFGIFQDSIKFALDLYKEMSNLNIGVFSFNFSSSLII